MRNAGKRLGRAGDQDYLQHDAGPPLSVDEVRGEFQRLRETLGHKRKHFPDEVPNDHTAAANWWIRDMQRPASMTEKPRRIDCVGGGKRWYMPYTERMLAALRIYVELPDDDRNLIIACAADKIWWNGDQIRGNNGQPGVFISMYEETLRLRESGSVANYLRLKVGESSGAELSLLKTVIGGHASRTNSEDLR